MASSEQCAEQLPRWTRDPFTTSEFAACHGLTSTVCPNPWHRLLTVGRAVVCVLISFLFLFVTPYQTRYWISTVLTS